MDSFRRLDQLINRGVTVTVPVSDDGFCGRECPNPNCQKYFGIVLGTGLEGENLPCHCPYCGHADEHSSFYTKDQIKHVSSVIQQKVSDAMFGDLQELSAKINSQQDRASFLQMSAKTTRSHRPTIHSYDEKQLETELVCSFCTLRYTVYGVFAYCPDCGQHNAFQILMNNLEVIVKVLALSESEERTAEERDNLVQNALEDCVSIFDAFGREICRIHASSAANPGRASKLSFQNLEVAKRNVSKLFGFELDSGLHENQLKAGIQAFQKRHLLAHKLGIVDAEYLEKSGDPDAVIGRKVTISIQDVHQLISVVELLAKNLHSGLQRKATLTVLPGKIQSKIRFQYPTK